MMIVERWGEWTIQQILKLKKFLYFYFYDYFFLLTLEEDNFEPPVMCIINLKFCLILAKLSWDETSSMIFDLVGFIFFHSTIFRSILLLYFFEPFKKNPKYKKTQY